MILLDEWQAYARWRDKFEEVIDPRFYSIAWLDGEMLHGRARCWADNDAAIVAELRTYPAGGREVHGLVAAGDLVAAIGLIAHAEQWGRENGCCVSNISSRPGWQRAMQPHGYDLYQVMLRKEL